MVSYTGYLDIRTCVNETNVQINKKFGHFLVISTENVQLSKFWSGKIMN